MKKLALFLMASIVTLSGCKTAPKEELRRDDGLYNTFTIEGATITPEVLNKEKVVMMQNLSMTDIPDHEMLMLYPHSGMLLSTTNEVLKTLFPNVKTYVLDGKKVSKKDFYAEPSQMLFTVKYADGTLTATTREDLNDNSVPYTGVSEEGVKWYIECLLNGVTIPESIVVNNPMTMPEHSIINGTNYLMVTPEKAIEEAKTPGAGFYLSMYGSIPELSILTNAYRLEYGIGPSDSKVTLPVNGLKSLAVKNIVEAIPNPIEEVTAISCTTDSVTVFLLSPEARDQIAAELAMRQN